MIMFNPDDWYWQVAGVGIYGSARHGLVSAPTTDAAYLAFNAANGPGSIAADTAYLDATLQSAGLPPSGLTPPTQAQLLTYANGKVQSLLGTARPYTVAGLSGPVVDDLGPVTALTMNTAFVMQSALTYPYKWSDDNYTIWSMTQDQLIAFLEAAFAYGDSVWALANGTAFSGINAGSITTTAQIDALSWPT